MRGGPVNRILTVFKARTAQIIIYMLKEAFILCLLVAATVAVPGPCNAGLEGCSECTVTGGYDCTKCYAGYRWVNTECVRCKNGMGIAASIATETTTQTCSVTCNPTSGCEACEGDGTTCLLCKAGNRWNGSGCTLCENGKGKGTDSSIKVGDPAESCTVTCTSPCNVCTNSPTSCVNCIEGHNYGGAYNCEFCPLGKGKNKDTVDKSHLIVAVPEECTLNCAAGCLVCGPDASTCLNCKEGYKWTGSGCELCGDGTGKGQDTVNKRTVPPAGPDTCTTSCTSGCNTCTTSASECLNCKAGYFWEGSKICKLCSGKKGKAKDTTDKTGTSAETNDVACNIGCTSLFGCDACEGDGETCLNCRAGWAWRGASEPKKCSLCNIGTGKAADTEDKLLAKPTTDESLTCATTCTLGCGVCTGTNTECVNCRAGYFWAGSNTCTLCSGKKGKADDSDDKTGTP